MAAAPTLGHGMRVLAESLGYAVSAGFLFLAVKAAQDLWTHPDRRNAYLASAIGGLAILALASQLELAYPPISGVASDVAVVSLMASAFALFLFRGTFVPLRRATFIVVGAAVATAAVISEIGPLISGAPTALASAVALAPIAVWLLCAGEPTVRFWIAAARRPAVQRSRLRALSFGYGAIILILLLSVGGGAGIATDTGRLLVVLMWAVALAMLPMLYIAFWPPAWVRSQWRHAEELSFRRALQGLLLAGTREQADAAVVEWGMRLVGAGAAALVVDGRPVISTGMSASDADSLAVDVARQAPLGAGALELRGQRLHLVLRQAGGQPSGVLVLLPGEFTPIFGADEVESLRQFGVAATAALERLTLIAELSRANSAKSEFLSRMSHELRTPLNSVLGFAQLLAMEIKDPKQSRQVGHINQAGKNLLALINDILDTARIEAGQLSVSMERVSLAESIRAAVELITPLADKRGLTIAVDLPDDGRCVLADANRLSQILINLLSNAVKYNREAGRIHVFCESTPAASIRIHVTDTGMGIDAADQDLVFQPFTRLNADRTSVEGTGIGLGLARSLAELMHGSVGFRSRLLEGSDFWVDLPEMPPAPPAQQASSTSSTGSSSRGRPRATAA
jgi:signal transduction histidine kinase